MEEKLLNIHHHHQKEAIDYYNNRHLNHLYTLNRKYYGKLILIGQVMLKSELAYDVSIDTDYTLVYSMIKNKGLHNKLLELGFIKLKDYVLRDGKYIIVVQVSRSHSNVPSYAKNVPEQIKIYYTYLRKNTSKKDLKIIRDDYHKFIYEYC